MFKMKKNESKFVNTSNQAKKTRSTAREEMWGRNNQIEKWK